MLSKLEGRVQDFILPYFTSSLDFVLHLRPPLPTRAFPSGHLCPQGIRVDNSATCRGRKEAILESRQPPRRHVLFFASSHEHPGGRPYRRQNRPFYRHGPQRAGHRLPEQSQGAVRGDMAGERILIWLS